jgi:putative ATP-dependent endonuclease of the OLD family
MLGLIAQRRKGRVIFAMEEPELSLPPHVQKRVVDKVRSLASQALFTSHSPYVIEQFPPDGNGCCDAKPRRGIASHQCRASGEP